MLDASDWIAVTILFVAVGVGGLALYLMHGRARLGPILHSFAQMALVPERTRQFVIVLWIEVLFFLAAGVLLGLYDLGVRFTSDPDFLFTVAFLGGVASLGVLTWVSLRPRPLTEEERAAAERIAPTVMESLWLVPYRRFDDEGGRRKQSK